LNIQNITYLAFYIHVCTILIVIVIVIIIPIIILFSSPY